MANFKNIFRGPRVLSFYNRPKNYSKREEAKDGRPSTIFFVFKCNLLTKASFPDVQKTKMNCRSSTCFLVITKCLLNGEHLVQVFFVSLQNKKVI